ncbi:recombinase RecT [bacterium]|nr:recombinase RecT [bacterium]
MIQENNGQFIVDEKFSVSKANGKYVCACGKPRCPHLAQVSAYLNQNTKKKYAGVTTTPGVSHATIQSPYGSEEVQALRLLKVVPENAPPAALWLLHRYAVDSGLSPFKRQIYLQVRTVNDEPSYSVELGIDGLRAVAERTGTYAGSDDAIFEYDKSGQVQKATVTLWKIVKNIRCPFTGSARWIEFCPPDKRAFMWRKMPHGQLAKCAEALALRKAFPNLGGFYISEEMDQAGEILSAAEASADLARKTAPTPTSARQDKPTEQTVQVSEPVEPPHLKPLKTSIATLCAKLSLNADEWLTKEFGVALDQCTAEIAALAITRLTEFRAKKTA